jgi:hypothetical protein
LPQYLGSSQLTPSPAFEISVVDDEVVLLNPKTLKVAHLNRTAALIWQLCDGVRVLGDLRALLTAAYPETAAEVVADLDETVAALAAVGALTGLAVSADGNDPTPQATTS